MKIHLLILGLVGIGNCGDAAFDGADLGGLYDGNFLHDGYGGYGGDFESIQEIGDAFKVEPPLAPPLGVGYDEATPPPHFHGLGQFPRHSFPRPRPPEPVDQGYGYAPSRHPAFYDDIDAGRPIIKPIVPVVKKLVAKPFHFPRHVFRHDVPLGRPPISKPGVVSVPIVKEVGQSHLGGYGKSYPGHGHAQLVGGIGNIHDHHLANVHQYLYPRPSIYKSVVPLYKSTPFSIQPSLSYGYSYKLVPTYAYGPAILADHAGIGYAHGYRHQGPAQVHY